MVEHSAVNRVVVGSSPTRGVSVFTKKLYSRVLRDRDAYLLLEIADTGPLVKRLRHRPFTAVTRVRFPSGSFIADVAQLAEQLICNQQVIGSSPIIGFYYLNIYRKYLRTFSSVG